MGESNGDQIGLAVCSERYKSRQLPLLSSDQHNSSSLQSQHNTINQLPLCQRSNSTHIQYLKFVSTKTPNTQANVSLSVKTLSQIRESFTHTIIRCTSPKPQHWPLLPHSQPYSDPHFSSPARRAPLAKPQMDLHSQATSRT